MQQSGYTNMQWLHQHAMFNRPQGTQMQQQSSSNQFSQVTTSAAAGSHVITPYMGWGQEQLGFSVYGTPVATNMSQFSDFQGSVSLLTRSQNSTMQIPIESSVFNQGFSTRVESENLINTHPSEGVVPLDRMEAKILFNTHETIWDPCLGTTYRKKDFSSATPSIHSGSWNVLMQSAVSEASSSATGVQEEWSGLAYQSIDTSTDNQLTNLISNKNQQTTRWVDNTNATQIEHHGQLLHTNEKEINDSRILSYDKNHKLVSLSSSSASPRKIKGPSKMHVASSTASKNTPIEGARSLETSQARASPKIVKRPSKMHVVSSTASKNTPIEGARSLETSQACASPKIIKRPSKVHVVSSTASKNTPIEGARSLETSQACASPKIIKRPSKMHVVSSTASKNTPIEGARPLETSQGCAFPKLIKRPSKMHVVSGTASKNTPIEGARSLETSQACASPKIIKRPSKMHVVSSTASKNMPIEGARSLETSQARASPKIIKRPSKMHVVSSTASKNTPIEGARSLETSQAVSAPLLGQKFPCSQPYGISATSHKVPLCGSASSVFVSDSTITLPQKMHGVSSEVVGTSQTVGLAQVRSGETITPVRPHQKVNDGTRPQLAKVKKLTKGTPSSIYAKIDLHPVPVHGFTLAEAAAKRVSTENPSNNINIRANVEQSQGNSVVPVHGFTLAEAAAKRVSTENPSKNINIDANVEQSQGNSVVPSKTAKTGANITNQRIARPKKHKTLLWEGLAWRNEVSQGSQGPPNISKAEREWAQATNRIFEKVEDEVLALKDMQPIPQSRTRLILTTQLMQQLLGPVPAFVLSKDVLLNYDSVLYFVSRVALGNACSLFNRSRNNSLSASDKSNVISGESNILKKRANRCYEVVEGLSKRAKKLESDLEIWDEATSISVVKVEFQELEKFGLFNRFAKVHAGREAGGPFKHVREPSVLTLVPDKVRCLSL